VGVFSTGWQQEGYPASKSLHHYHHGMYFLSTPLPSLPSPFLSEKDMVGWCYGGCMDYGERESIQVHLEGWPLNWRMCMCNYVWFMWTCPWYWLVLLKSWKPFFSCRCYQCHSEASFAVSQLLSWIRPCWRWRHGTYIYIFHWRIAVSITDWSWSSILFPCWWNWWVTPVTVCV